MVYGIDNIVAFMERSGSNYYTIMLPRNENRNIMFIRYTDEAPNGTGVAHLRESLENSGIDPSATFLLSIYRRPVDPGKSLGTPQFQTQFRLEPPARAAAAIGSTNNGAQGAANAAIYGGALPPLYEQMMNLKVENERLALQNRIERLEEAQGSAGIGVIDRIVSMVETNPEGAATLAGEIFNGVFGLANIIMNRAQQGAAALAAAAPVQGALAGVGSGENSEAEDEKILEAANALQVALPSVNIADTLEKLAAKVQENPAMYEGFLKNL